MNALTMLNAQTIPADYNAFIYSLEGRVKVGTDPKTETVDAHSTIILSKSDTQDHVEISTTATESAHFVLIAGRPNNEPIVQHGPFVMCSEEEIQQTFRDYQNGKHGFERAKSFASKIASQQRRR